MALSTVRAIVGDALAAGASSVEASKNRRQTRKIIRPDTVTIKGHIQKPRAFYILPRSSLDFRGLELKESFIPKILRAIEKDPF